MACDCPDAVTATLRKVVQEELNKINSIKSLVEEANKTLAQVAAFAQPVVRSAVSAIPTLPALDFSTALQYLTCPLTPLAMALDPSILQEMDPRTLFAQLKTMWVNEIAAIRKGYDDTLRQSAQWQNIKLHKVIADNIRRIKFDAVSFANAVVITATVQSTCSDEFTAGPYEEFAQALQGFSLEGAGIPSNLDNNVKAVINELIAGEIKFDVMRETLAAAALPL